MEITLPSKEEIIKTRGAILTPQHYLILQQRNQKIASMKLNGKTYKQIALLFNLSRSYIKTICHRYGISGNPNEKGLFRGMRPSPKGSQRVRQRKSH